MYTCIAMSESKGRGVTALPNWKKQSADGTAAKISPQPSTKQVSLERLLKLANYKDSSNAPSITLCHLTWNHLLECTENPDFSCSSYTSNAVQVLLPPVLENWSDYLMQAAYLAVPSTSCPVASCPNNLISLASLLFILLISTQEPSENSRPFQWLKNIGQDERTKL